FLFFFSSRRRHTSFSRDWSSDVCSSDLSRAVTATADTSRLAIEHFSFLVPSRASPPRRGGALSMSDSGRTLSVLEFQVFDASWRSEERRAGKVCSTRWPEEHTFKYYDHT